MQFPFTRELWAVNVALLAWFLCVCGASYFSFMSCWALERNDIDCNANKTTNSRSLEASSNDKVSSLCFFPTRAFSFLMRVAFETLQKVDYPRFSLHSRWFVSCPLQRSWKVARIFPKKEREMRKEKFDPNTFVRRSQLKALRRNVDNERQKNIEKSWSEKVDLTDRTERREKKNVCNNS